MRLPTIHLNGSHPETLRDDALAATEALREALRKLDACAPNARDYYPQGGAAFDVAVDEHKVRAIALRGVLTELTDIAEHAQAAIDERDVRARRAR